MEIQKDFKELLGLFNAHKVEYLIVGGYAVAFYGAPRYTGDIDIYVKPDKDNARNIMKAIEDFGFGNVGLTEEDFIRKNKVVQLGYPPVRIDIVTSISAVTANEAFLNKVAGKYGDLPVFFIGKKQLIKNKHSCGRKKDHADLEALDEE